MTDNSYIEDVAKQIRGKFNESDLPTAGLDELFNAYALLALSKGTSVTNEDVHDAWSAWATKFEPDNDSLVPFDELSVSIQNTDTPFAIAIREVAANLPE
jgi:hypothetical protein